MSLLRRPSSRAWRAGSGVKGGCRSVVLRLGAFGSGRAGEAGSLPTGVLLVAVFGLP